MMRDDAIQRLASLALAAGLVAATPARAQTIPEGQSCGGLLCDFGVIGHKTAPLPTTAPAPVPAATPAPAPAPEKSAVLEKSAATTRRSPHHPRKRVARASVVKSRPVETGLSRPPVAKAVPSTPPAAAAASTVPASHPSVAATRAPVYQRPMIFQSIDPMLQ